MDFGLQIVIKALVDNDNGKKANMISSPLSIAAMSSILAFRFDGSNQQTMLQLLGSKTLDDLKSNYSKLAAASSTCQGHEDPLLNFINGCWSDQNYKIQPCFDHALKSVFNAHIKSLDFQKTAESAQEINLWVKESTKGLITAIVEEQSLFGVLTILANVLYFKGKWKVKFMLDRSDRYFYTGEGKQVVAPFIRSASTFKYGSFKDFSVAKLPYKCSGQDGRKFSLNLFLPNQKDGLSLIVKEISVDPSLFLSKILSALYWQDFEEFLIPKFILSYEFELTDIMDGFGLDMSGTKVFQKARIIVDEEGTEAAAVTYYDDYGCCIDDDDDDLPSFIADHPFMFVISEDTSGMPFFVGVVVDPLVDK